MRKLFYYLHLWLSIPVGLFITIICFSGAILIFEKEITEGLNRNNYYIENAGQTAPLEIDYIINKVSDELPDSIAITGVIINKDPQRAYTLSLSKPRKASINVNQYTGEIISNNSRSGFFLFVFKLHRWLLDSPNQNGSISYGKTIVGVSTLIFVFILLTGLVIWVPRNAASIKSRLQLNVKKGWRRFFYDLHIAGGFYCLIILLTLSLTGLTWSFNWYKDGFYKLFGVETTVINPNNINKPAKNIPNKGGKRDNKIDAMKWQKVYNTLSFENPRFEYISINNGTANVSFNNYGNRRASDKYSFNSKSGEITDINLYSDQKKSEKIRGWIYSVHVGNWGGHFTSIITLIAALIGASLPITGYYFYFKKLINKRNRYNRKR